MRAREQRKALPANVKVDQKVGGVRVGEPINAKRVRHFRRKLKSFCNHFVIILASDPAPLRKKQATLIPSRLSKNTWVQPERGYCRMCFILPVSECRRTVSHEFFFHDGVFDAKMDTAVTVENVAFG